MLGQGILFCSWVVLYSRISLGWPKQGSAAEEIVAKVQKLMVISENPGGVEIKDRGIVRTIKQALDALAFLLRNMTAGLCFLLLLVATI